MSKTQSCDETTWAEKPLESFVEETRVRLTWQTPQQSHLTSVDGTVIEVDPTVEFVRLATPAQTGELHLYRRPDHTAVSVVAITHTDIVKLGSLYELTILERSPRPEADSKSNAPILEWRCE